jgi:dimethylsulfoniopropionate demethylase
MMVARSGFSKKGGFEIYLNDASLAEPLWDELFRLGEDLHVKPGGPNLIERVESGLLSYGNDMTDAHNPFECGLDAYMDIDADIESISLPALRAIAGKHEHQLVGLVFDQDMVFEDFKIAVDNRIVGEIRSHVWSPRYQKHLAMTMMKRDYLGERDTLTVEGVTARVVDLPFDFDAIN